MSRIAVCSVMITALSILMQVIMSQWDRSILNDRAFYYEVNEIKKTFSLRREKVKNAAGYEIQYTKKTVYEKTVIGTACVSTESGAKPKR